jgi:ATP synthase protein I
MKTEQNQPSDLSDLKAKIKAAQSEVKSGLVGSTDKMEANGPEALKAGRIGFELAGAILAGVGFGILIDRAFGTAPFGVLVLVILGFVAGMANAWRAFQQMNGQENLPAIGWRRLRKKK